MDICGDTSLLRHCDDVLKDNRSNLMVIVPCQLWKEVWAEDNLVAADEWETEQADRHLIAVEEEMERENAIQRDKTQRPSTDAESRS
jgi:hypothetical protein